MGTSVTERLPHPEPTPALLPSRCSRGDPRSPYAGGGGTQGGTLGKRNLGVGVSVLPARAQQARDPGAAEEAALAGPGTLQGSGYPGGNGSGRGGGGS